MNQINPANLPESVEGTLNTYFKALITPEFIFYVNFEESDENASVVMYNIKGELLSNNYFASEALFEVIKEGTYTWVSGEMQCAINMMND